MSDNTVLNLGVGGDTIATDDISGVKHQYVKIEYGADNSATPVSPANPLPISVATLPNEAGTWTYNAGVTGSYSASAGKRVLQITMVGGAGGGTLTINGGDSIPIPQDVSLAISPRANLIAPSMVFSNTTAYFIELVQ